MRQVLTFNNKNWPLPYMPPVPVDDRLKFTAIENSTFGLSRTSTVASVEYSLDDGSTWTNLTTSSTVNLNQGLVAYLRGKITGTKRNNDRTQFTMSGNIAASGNIMYLYDYETLPTTIAYNSAFLQLFGGCSALSAAPELPATSLSESCYSGMFSSCTSLTSAPELPATTAPYDCYGLMFRGCTNLINAPKILPLTTLGIACCYLMFENCTNLTTAPELPASELVEQCYMEMFKNCTKLNYVKCLASNEATFATYYWLNGVATTGTFVKASSMTDWSTGPSGIPSDWTIQNA